MEQEMEYWEKDKLGERGCHLCNIRIVEDIVPIFIKILVKTISSDISDYALCDRCWGRVQ